MTSFFFHCMQSQSWVCSMDSHLPRVYTDPSLMLSFLFSFILFRSFVTGQNIHIQTWPHRTLTINPLMDRLRTLVIVHSQIKMRSFALSFLSLARAVAGGVNSSRGREPRLRSMYRLPRAHSYYRRSTSRAA